MEVAITAIFAYPVYYLWQSPLGHPQLLYLHFIDHSSFAVGPRRHQRHGRDHQQIYEKLFAFLGFSGCQQVNKLAKI
jgi:hypothetical protein